MKKKVLITILMSMILFAVLSVSVSAANTTLEALQQKFPNRKYWNSGNVDTYTSSPCTHHTPSKTSNCDIYGSCGCTSFNGIQCNGFARKVTYDYYGSQFMSWSTTTNTNNIKAGDVIYYNYHYMWVIARNGNTLTLGECNYGGACMIEWGRTISIPSSCTIYVAPYAISDNSEPPSAPTNCLAGSWDDRVQIQWDTVSNANEYECGLIDINTNNVIVNATVNDWYYNFYGVPEGQYFAYVCAHNSAGTSSHSNWYRVDVAYTVPAAPTIKFYTDKTVEGNNVLVSWDAVEGANRYVYFLTEFPEGFAYGTNRKTGTISETSIEFTDLENGHYTMFVHAVSPLGKWSEQSNWETIDIYAKDYIPTKIISKNNHIYALYDYEMSWSFAKDLCTDLGGHLVTITNQNENEIITELIDYGVKDAYWIGASDYGREEKDFSWVTEEGFSYSNWVNGEPSSSGIDGEKEHFAEIRKLYGYKWNDVNNINKSDKGFILEIDTENITFTATEIFNNNKYILFDKNTTWTEANYYCKMLGGHLVTINSDRENEFLKEFLQHGNRYWYYIGAERKNGAWQWIDGNDFNDITWKDTASDWEGNYLMMYKSSKDCVGFNNAYFPESDIKHIGFVCEIEADDNKTLFANSLSIKDDVIFVNSQISNLSQQAIYTVAMYTADGKLVDVKTQPLDSGATSASVSLAKNDRASYIKVYLWDSLNSMKPLAEREKIEL